MGKMSLECSYTELPVLCPLSFFFFFSPKKCKFFIRCLIICGFLVFLVFFVDFFHVCGDGVWLGFFGGVSRSGEVGACFRNIEEGRECKTAVLYFLLSTIFP